MKITTSSLLMMTAAFAGAFPATTTLDLVDDPSGTFNALDVTVAITVLFTFRDSDTTTVSGTAGVRLDIDPATDEVSEMTLLGGDVAATPLSFNLVVASLASGPLGGTVFTTVPPGVVDPSSATFAADQHEFLINEGMLTGSAEVDFSVEPVGGAGSGTGTVVLVRTGTTATTAEYDVQVELPVNSTNFSDVGGNPARVDIAGTLQAAGTVSVPLDAYVAWTFANGIPGAPFGGDENGDGISNGLLWGLGLTATENPSPHLPAAAGAGGVPAVTVALPAGGSGAPLFVEVAGDPAGPWVLADGGALSTGTNPIPAGTAGTVTAAFPSGVAGYARLRVAAP